MLYILACDCDIQGSSYKSCNSSGICTCKNTNIVGIKCSECKPGLVDFPYCHCKYFFKIEFLTIFEFFKIMFSKLWFLRYSACYSRQDFFSKGVAPYPLFLIFQV